MNAANNDRYPTGTKVSRYFIGAVSLRSEGGNAHQIGGQHLLVIGTFDIFVNNSDLPVRRSEISDCHQTQRFPHAEAIPAAVIEIENRDQWVRRINKE